MEQAVNEVIEDSSKYFRERRALRQVKAETYVKQALARAAEGRSRR
jgi:hypothetical protein